MQLLSLLYANSGLLYGHAGVCSNINSACRMRRGKKLYIY